MHMLKTYKDVKNSRREAGDKLLLFTMFLNLILIIMYMAVSKYANVLNLFNESARLLEWRSLLIILLNSAVLYFALSINRMLLYFPVNKEREKLRKVFSSNPVELLIVNIFQILIKFMLIFMALYIIIGSVLQMGLDSGVATPYSVFNPELLHSGFLEVNIDFLAKLFTWKDIALAIGLIVAIEAFSLKLLGAKYIVLMSDAAVGIFRPFIDSFKSIKGDYYKVLFKIRFKYIILAILPIPFLIIPLIFTSRFLLIIYGLFTIFYELYIRAIYLEEEAFFIGHGPLGVQLYDYLLYKAKIDIKTIELSNKPKTCGIK